MTKMTKTRKTRKRRKRKAWRVPSSLQQCRTLHRCQSRYEEIQAIRIFDANIKGLPARGSQASHCSSDSRARLRFSELLNHCNCLFKQLHRATLVAKPAKQIHFRRSENNIVPNHQAHAVSLLGRRSVVIRKLNRSDFGASAISMTTGSTSDSHPLNESLRFFLPLLLLDSFRSLAFRSAVGEATLNHNRNRAVPLSSPLSESSLASRSALSPCATSCRTIQDKLTVHTANFEPWELLVELSSRLLNVDTRMLASINPALDVSLRIKIRRQTWIISYVHRWSSALEDGCRYGTSSAAPWKLSSNACDS